jgi:NAD(P)-dependent dehydrogenase (short-subunit alcohol dehydrogenase family)
MIGKVAVVTGAARGIGMAIAENLLKEGCSVVLADILAEKLKDFVNQLSGPLNVFAVTADISVRSEVEDMVNSTLKKFGTIDILVNNAGIVHPAALEKVQDEDWDKVVNVNLKGTYYCTAAVVPTMKNKRFGRIINIGSRACLGKTDRTVYSATKAGVVGMTRTWALELAPFNITVNSVNPGGIATELFKEVNPADSIKTKALVNSIPLGRMGTPEEVANLVNYLASEKASFITGQTIFICGGLSIGAH